MSDHDEGVQGVALGVGFGVIALVIAGVIALAVGRMQPAAPAAPLLPPMASVYFEVGQDSLSTEASEQLARVSDAARENSGAQVLISGYHDASGNPAANAELARRRAERVRHALQANGVPASQLVLSKPALTRGGDDARSARRVEIRLQ